MNAPVSAVAVLVGAAPAGAAHTTERAQDERACAHRDNSPTARHQRGQAATPLGRHRGMLHSLLAAVVAVVGLAGTGAVPVEAQTSPAVRPSFYVANPANNSVTAYALGADGNVAPVATISGAATRLSRPSRVALDGAGRIFVFNINQTVTEYAPGADGNVAPSTTISCCASAPSPAQSSPAVYGDRLYLADTSHSAVRPYAIGPTGGLVAEGWLAGSATGLENPWASAFDPSGHLYVANLTAASITRYAPGATGSVPPVATISGPATGLARPSSIAVDESGRVYVGDSTTNTINVYAAGASGDAAPVSTFSGPATGLDGVSGLAIDGSGRLVATNAGDHSVTVYDRAATGDAAPMATIAGADTGLASPQGIAATPVLTITTSGILPSARPGEAYTYALAASGGTTPYSWSLASGSALPAGLALGADGVISGTSSSVGTTSFTATVLDRASPSPHRATRAFSLSIVPDAVSSFYVANQFDHSITRHAAGADGDLAPVATIAGANTGLSNPSGLLIDGAGRLYSANYVASTVTAYGPDAWGDVAPVVTIAGSSTGLRGPTSMVIDSSGRLYVSNSVGDSVTVYAPGTTGNAAPVATIAGPATGLSRPSALAFDRLGRLIVGNVDNNTVTTYEPGADGDVAPVATIGGAATGLRGPSGLLVDGSGALLVANISANTLTKYASGASGNVAPIATVAGHQTGLGEPRGLALDGSGRLIVTNSTGSTVKQYAPGADGDVAPVATLVGPATGLRGPIAVVVVPSVRLAPSITLAPSTATNELGTAGQTHTVTATVAAGPSGGMAGVPVSFSITSGPNVGQSGNDTTDAAGEATFTYPATQGPAGLGTDAIQACLTGSQGTTSCANATKQWVDTTPPQVECGAITNPSGTKIPNAGNNPTSGQNRDGFYTLTATDAVDPNPTVTLADSASGATFGPFSSGTSIKLTKAPGATPDQKPGPGVIDWHITIKGDAILTATDAAGNTSAPIACLVIQ